MEKQYKKLVIFDFDGSSNDSYLAIKATFESFNFRFLSRKQFRSYSKYGKFLRHGLWKDLKLCFHVLSSEFAQSLITHYQLFACGDRSSFYPQVRDLILKLQERDDVAVLFLSRNFLSNVAFRVLMRQIFDYQGIHMDRLYCVKSIHFWRTKGKAIRKAMKELKLQPEDCVMYGDEVTDWKTAWKQKIPEENIIIYGGEKSFDNLDRLKKGKVKQSQIVEDLDTIGDRILERIG